MIGNLLHRRACAPNTVGRDLCYLQRIYIGQSVYCENRSVRRTLGRLHYAPPNRNVTTRQISEGRTSRSQSLRHVELNTADNLGHHSSDSTISAATPVDTVGLGSVVNGPEGGVQVIGGQPDALTPHEIANKDPPKLSVAPLEDASSLREEDVQVRVGPGNGGQHLPGKNLSDDSSRSARSNQTAGAGHTAHVIFERIYREQTAKAAAQDNKIELAACSTQLLPVKPPFIIKGTRSSKEFGRQHREDRIRVGKQKCLVNSGKEEPLHKLYTITGNGDPNTRQVQVHYIHTLADVLAAERDKLWQRLRVSSLSLSVHYMHPYDGVPQVQSITLASVGDIVMYHVSSIEQKQTIIDRATGRDVVSRKTLPDGLRRLLEDSDVLKVGRDVHVDSAILESTFGIESQGILDLNTLLEEVQFCKARINPGTFRYQGNANAVPWRKLLRQYRPFDKELGERLPIESVYSTPNRLTEEEQIQLFDIAYANLIFYKAICDTWHALGNNHLPPDTAWRNFYTHPFNVEVEHRLGTIYEWSADYGVAFPKRILKLLVSSKPHSVRHFKDVIFEDREALPTTRPGHYVQTSFLTIVARTISKLLLDASTLFLRDEDRRLYEALLAMRDANFSGPWNKIDEHTLYSSSKLVNLVIWRPNWILEMVKLWEAAKQSTMKQASWVEAPSRLGQTKVEEGFHDQVQILSSMAETSEVANMSNAGDSLPTETLLQDPTETTAPPSTGSPAASKETSGQAPQGVVNRLQPPRTPFMKNNYGRRDLRVKQSHEDKPVIQQNLGEGLAIFEDGA